MNLGYRSFNKTVLHPKKYEEVTNEIFLSLKNIKKIQTAPKLVNGHTKTEIWLCDNSHYIVKVILDNMKEFYLKTPCTFTPTMGMDSIDGLFAQDAEEYILMNEIGIVSERLKVFQDKDEIEISKYLKFYGFSVTEEVKKEKKWWEIWK